MFVVLRINPLYLKNVYTPLNFNSYCTVYNYYTPREYMTHTKENYDTQQIFFYFFLPHPLIHTGK